MLKVTASCQSLNTAWRVWGTYGSASQQNLQTVLLETRESNDSRVCSIGNLLILKTSQFDENVAIAGELAQKDVPYTFPSNKKRLRLLLLFLLAFGISTDLHLTELLIEGIAISLFRIVQEFLGVVHSHESQYLSCLGIGHGKGKMGR